MKKRYLFVLLCSSALWACNNNSDGSGTSTTDSGSTTSTTTTSAAGNNASSGNMSTTDTANSSGNMSNTTKMSGGELGAADKEFVKKAAAGGMMEVELGNVAQQNASSQRVKDFGAMMVRDHSKANDELKSLASAKNVQLPADLPADEKKHVDMMKKMQGKDFDMHYISMMVNDHKKDIGEFEKSSSSAKDADLKNFSTKTLPVLKTHLDSAQAINKSKM